MTLMTGQKWFINHYVNISQAAGYDGDGNKVQEGLAGQSTYYLRSSVMDDAIIAEINSSGQKNVGYVYSDDGELLARQVPAGSSSYIAWKHDTPAGTGQFDYNVGGAFGSGSLNRIELDPLGANIGLTAPDPPDTNGGQGDIGGRHIGGIMDARWSNFFDLSSGCSVAGVAASCSGSMAQTNMDAEMRAAFGDRRYDLPGNNNEREQAEGIYVAMVQRTIAAYNSAQTAKTKPKLKPPKHKPRHLTPDERRKLDEKRRRDLAKNGNNEDVVGGVVGDSLFSGITIEHFSDYRTQQIKAELPRLFTPKCADAFHAFHLKSPEESIMHGGLVIRPDTDLNSHTAAQLNLKTEEQRLNYLSEFRGGAQGGSFTADDTTNGRAQMYLAPKAWAGPDIESPFLAYFDEVITHEMMHVGGAVTARAPAWRLGGFRHDLVDLPGYKEILAACK